MYSYHVDDFDNVQELQTPLRDGWGATSDGRSVIVSDGSSKLSWLDPATLALRRSVEVRDGIHPVRYLNEVGCCCCCPGTQPEPKPGLKVHGSISQRQYDKFCSSRSIADRANHAEAVATLEHLRSRWDLIANR